MKNIINHRKLDEVALAPFAQRITKDKIDTCLISEKSLTVLQYYKNRKMAEKLHKVNSVTKSVLSILVGIAIDQGAIAGIDQPIRDFLPNCPQDKQELTIEHLLTMTPGFDWPEFGAWGGRPFPMINSKDWVQFVLERDMLTSPGQTMFYNSGCSHLLSAIVQKAVGMSLTQFAERQLFKPLGIQEYDWHIDSKGIIIGGFGLSLKARDMLNIGRLMLLEGVWKEQRIVSAEWVQASSLAGFHTHSKIGAYGYHWWILADESGHPVEPYTYFAMGYGGQYIIVVPKHELVVSMTSELYRDTFRPLSYFRELILPIL
ncbi:serine hydrolase domain-containing protein [Brevibacillus ginsengisoli]|uniref:serine hydrolase domain-containing protein n=1 Tax=Brevibacillus ginsengisoli TaxID=363854 RepID=UPI003CF9B810